MELWISWLPSLEVGMVPGQSWDSGWWLAGGWGWLTSLVTEYFPPKYLLSAINNRFPPSSGGSPALKPTHKHLFALCFVVIRSEGRLGDYQRRFPSATLDARLVWRVRSLVKDAATWWQSSDGRWTLDRAGTQMTSETRGDSGDNDCCSLISSLIVLLDCNNTVIWPAVMLAPLMKPSSVGSYCKVWIMK